MQTDVVVQRIIAFIIDSIVWLILTLVLVGVLSAAGVDMFDAERNSDDSGFYWRASLTNSWTWVWSALFLLYKGGQEALYGQTIGKRLLKIRVVKAHTFATINWQDAFLRNLIFLAPFILLNTEYGILELIGFIWLVAGTISMIRSSERQRLGDRAANTVVVRNVPAAQPAAVMDLQRSVAPAVQTSLDPESWIVCAHCGSQFQGKQALSGTWQGQSFPTCPNCGAPIEPGKSGSTRSATEQVP